MIVILDAFSGRPNPSWRLSEKDAAKVIERVAGRAQALAETEAPSILGPTQCFLEQARCELSFTEGPSVLAVLARRERSVILFAHLKAVKRYERELYGFYQKRDLGRAAVYSTFSAVVSLASPHAAYRPSLPLRSFQLPKPLEVCQKS
jgi:hypothetical protein